MGTGRDSRRVQRWPKGCAQGASGEGSTISTDVAADSQHCAQIATGTAAKDSRDLDVAKAETPSYAYADASSETTACSCTGRSPNCAQRSGRAYAEASGNASAAENQAE